MLDINSIYLGDCLEIMKEISDKSIDMVLCDPPYGTTACKWDVIIPFEPMWKELKRIIKDKGCIALFGSEPFSSKLRLSNLEDYKYDWIWNKGKGSNPLLSKKRPMSSFENISIFNAGIYYPQMRKGKPYKAPRTGGNHTNSIIGNNEKQGEFRQKDNPEGEYFPLSILPFSIHCGSKLHPSQTPVDLFSYLINTYTKEGELILDFTAGSGTTAISCLQTKRNYILIEKDKSYFNIIKERIKEENKRIEDSIPFWEKNK
jgi:site-specific DNA-methyltransferase (adenine-specific)